MLNLSEETLLLELEKAKVQELVAAWVVLGVLMVAGFVGNVLVVIVYGRRFQPSTNRSYILALAVLDLISTGVCIPLEMVSLSHRFTFRWSTMCRVMRYLTGSVLASFSVLALISVDRCRRVWRSGRQFRSQTVTRTLIVIIVGTHILTIPSLIVHGIKTYDVDVKSDNFLAVYRRLLAESAQGPSREENDTALLNLKGRKCVATDNYDDTSFYQIYIGLVIALAVIDSFILIVMYGAIGLKAYGVIRHRKKTPIGTSSTEVTSLDVDLESQNHSMFTSTAAERRNASNLHGNDEGEASIRHCSSKDWRPPRRRASTSQGTHLSLRPLLLLSSSSQSCASAWNASSRSSSWPRRRGKVTPKSVRFLPEIEQEEAAEEETREKKEHARRQSLSSAFHSEEMLDLPQWRRKEELLISPNIPEIICQHSSGSGRYVSNQDDGNTEICTLKPQENGIQNKSGAELQTESQGYEQDSRTSKPAEGGNREYGFHDNVADSRSVSSRSKIVPDQEARGPSGQSVTLARGCQLQLRHERSTGGGRTTLMLFLVTVTYLVSGLPYVVTKTLELWRPESVTNLRGPSLVLYHLALRSYFLQSATNPILYSLCVPHFRQQCRRLLSVARRR